MLKEKISALCEKYIHESDIILANSPALQASRKVSSLRLQTLCATQERSVPGMELDAMKYSTSISA